MVPGNMYKELQTLSVDFEYTVPGAYGDVGGACMDIPVIKDAAEAVTGYDAINGERTEVEDTPAFWDVRDYVRIAMQLQGLSLERITAIEWIGSWE